MTARAFPATQKILVLPEPFDEETGTHPHQVASESEPKAILSRYVELIEQAYSE